MQLKRILTALTAFAVVGVVWFVLLLQKGSRDHQPSPAKALLSAIEDNYAQSTSAKETGKKPVATSSEEQSAYERLREVARALASAQTPEESSRLLKMLREYLTGLPPQAAVRAIRTFLNTRADTPTKLDFTIGSDGHLKEAPSLRVCLLDCLGQTDRNAAADYARLILSTSTSANEWAVSLRDYALARTEPQDVAFVQSKALELIQNTAWQRNPSSGFLEAFDTIVYTKATTLTPNLAKLMTRKDNRAVAHAAFLTLDRLVIEQPREVLGYFTANPDAMQGREETRANYFARANVCDPEQRRLLESYLLDPHRAPQELQTFTGIYPNANLMISNNLLTRSETPALGDLATHDREALTVVDSWLADPRFTRLKPQIEQIRSRLATFLRQASAAHDPVSPQ